MKQKVRKMKLGLKILSLLSCVALLSVGFAAWWIVTINDGNKPTVSGSFNAYAVGTKEVTVTVNDITDSTITFGRPNPVDNTNKWLRADTDMAVEDLTGASMTFTVAADEGAALSSLLSKVHVEFAPANDAFSTAVASNYIAAPVITATYGNGQAITVPVYSNGKIEFDLPAAALTNNTVTVTLNFTFAWGSAVGSQNPFAYFNGLGYSTENANKANTALSAIYALNGTSYNVTVTASI